MIVAFVFVAVVLAFVFRRRIQQWLQRFEGPIGRWRNERNQEQGFDAQNAYNYNNVQMYPQNVNYNDPNASYQYIPPQNPPIYPQNYQQNPQMATSAYYMPPQRIQANPYERNPSVQRSQVNDNEAQRRLNGSGVNPYLK